MNNDNRDRDAGVIGANVAAILTDLHVHINDEPFLQLLKESLNQLADLKFALDESSIVAITDRKGKIIYVNDKFCQISRFDRAELIGQDHRIVNSGYHSKAFMQELWLTITSGKVWRGEIKNKAKDGTYYWMNTTIVPFIDGSGKPLQYLAIRNEVTQLKKVEEELQNMMAQVMNIQEEERRRFSRELHDGVEQSLYSLLIQIDRLMSAGNGSDLMPLREQVSGIIEEVRGLAWQMRPSSLDDLGIVPAIRTHIENYMEHYGILVTLEITYRNRLDSRIETTIYRVIQEALTNTAKYADVSVAAVRILDLDTCIEVRIEDHGRGFIRSESSVGVGLFSMEERARSVGGRFELLSEPGKGTIVILSIPKPN